MVEHFLTVVHVTSSTNMSGGTRQALLLCRGLRERGLRVVLCAPDGGAILELARQAGLESHTLEFGSLGGQWRGSRTLRTIVQEVDADLVHSHHTKGHNVALLATFGGTFPPVVANRGVLFRPQFPAKFRTARTAAIITNSSAVKRVLEACRIPGEKIHVVHNACDGPAEDVIPRASARVVSGLGLNGATVVGAVGSGRPEKGFQYLVEAAPRILRAIPDAHFVLVGSGTDWFRSRLESLGIAERFRLPGHRNDVSAVMGTFDVFVIPSVGMDSCPNVLLEAMAVRLPAVGADTGGIPELIEEGKTGFVVPRGDPEALAEAVIQVVRNPERARKMGEYARRRVMERFSLAAKVERTLSVYRKVLAR